jgi:hypothetical protein
MARKHEVVHVVAGGTTEPRVYASRADAERLFSELLREGYHVQLFTLPVRPAREV